MEHESDGDTSFKLSPWKNPQMPGKETGESGDQKMNRGYPDYSIDKNHIGFLEEPRRPEETYCHLDFRENYELKLV